MRRTEHELSESACAQSRTDHLTVVKDDEPFALLKKFADRCETGFAPIGGNRMTCIVHQQQMARGNLCAANMAGLARAGAIARTDQDQRRCLDFAEPSSEFRVLH